jgi:hypothetical protein
VLVRYLGWNTYICTEAIINWIWIWSGSRNAAVRGIVQEYHSFSFRIHRSSSTTEFPRRLCTHPYRPIALGCKQHIGSLANLQTARSASPHKLIWQKAYTKSDHSSRVRHKIHKVICDDSQLMVIDAKPLH